MKIYERYDVCDNMIGWYATTEDPTEVLQTHSATYYQTRLVLQELGEVMGLEEKVEERE